MPSQETRPVALTLNMVSVQAFGVRKQVRTRLACLLHGLLGPSSQEIATTSATCLAAVQVTLGSTGPTKLKHWLCLSSSLWILCSKWREAAGSPVTVWRCAATAPLHRELVDRLLQSGPLTHSPAAGAGRQTAAWPCAGPALQKRVLTRLLLQVTGDRPYVAD